MTVEEYLEATFTGKDVSVRKAVVCADGFTMSVQGGTPYHYCSPREALNTYWKVEVGFPSSDVPEFAEYKDGEGSDTDSVFGYVPMNVVEAVAEQHGGVVNDV